MISAIYPGTFDPITNGHLDLMKRSLKVVDKLVIAVAENPAKHPLFMIKERVSLVKSSTEGIPNIEVLPFGNLLIEFCAEMSINIVIRGLRAISDFEYELQMSQMNRKMDGNIETLFLMPSEEYTFVSSKLVKEFASFGADVSSHVPPPVVEALAEKYPQVGGRP
ncbi:MAG: pantetheine-phosphate adenylyltransferase [Nitrospinota bacterium]